jgi:hypothetical protein
VTEAPKPGEPTLSEKETARSLFVEGDRRYRQGDFEGALEAFTAADEIMHLPTTGLERGRTQIKLGRLLEGRETLLKVQRLPIGSEENEVQQAAREEARLMADDVGVRIPSLRIKVNGLAPGAKYTARVDKHLIPEELLSFPYKVNPGPHLVVLQADGYAEEQRSVIVQERENQEVTFDLVVRKEGGSPDKPLLPIMSWVGFGVGAVGLTIGIVAGAVTLSKVSDLDAACPQGRDRCPPEAQEDIDDAQTTAHLSTAGFVIGSVGVLAGALGFFLFPSQAGDEIGIPLLTAVVPWAGPGTLGMSASGRF